MLAGPVTDAADLYGLIARLEGLGLTLLSVQASTGRPPLSCLSPTSPTTHRSTTMTTPPLATTSHRPPREA